MALQPIIAATASSVSVSSATQFDASLFETILIAASGLTSTDTVTVFALVNGTFVPASNLQGTAAGLTATVATIALPGGLTYAVSKSASAGTPGAVFWGGVYRAGG